MPAIQVAKTDTFETQRQRINEIGTQLFNITGGGSDLSAGNIKLGDGSRVDPSLAFSSDGTLGIYKATTKTIGYVSDGKKIVDISESSVTSYKNIIVQKRTLSTGGILLSNSGQNYDSGTYNNLVLVGGSGTGALATVVITGFTGSITSAGTGYKSGQFSNIYLTGGTGTGALATIEVESISGTITNAGSGYTGGLYSNVLLTGGSGTGAKASITVAGSLAGASAGTITGVVISDSGTGYTNGNILSANVADIGGTGSGFQFTVTSTPGRVSTVTFSSKGSGYSANNILQLPTALTNVSTTLKGSVANVTTTLSTSSSTITVTSTTGIIPGMQVNASAGSTGSLATQTTVSSVPTGTTIVLSATPTVAGAATLTFTSPGSLNEIEVTPQQAASIVQFSTVTKTGGPGTLAANTTVSSVNTTTNIVTLSANPTVAGVNAILSFTPPYGTPTTNFQYTIQKVGVVESFSITNGGNGYSEGDLLSASASDITQPIVYYVKNKTLQRLTFTGTISSSVFAAGDTINSVGGAITSSIIYKVETSGGNITSILIDNLNLSSGGKITKQGSPTEYTINTATSKFRYFIGNSSSFTENLSTFNPNLTLYVNNTYNFNYSDSSNSAHQFALSQFRDGIWSPSYIQGITSTLSTSASNITVSSSTGILPGMVVTVASGSGQLAPNTTVVSVNGTTVTLSSAPTGNGSANLDFRGVEYTDGVTRAGNTLKIKVSTSTPTLYYYCSVSNSTHADEGGDDNQEAVITISQNNPKVFGSGFELEVDSVNTTDVITGDSDTGNLEALSISATTSTIGSLIVSGSTNTSTLQSNSITTNSVTSSGQLVLNGTSVTVPINFSVGSSLSIESSSGNLTTSGTIKTTGVLNVNDFITITNNNIASTTDNDVQITPAAGRIAKISSTSALIIPSGSSSQRPIGALAQNGAIRFNTQTTQYEGYSASSASWSSLGGVRDLDGNTYILAEKTVGANDNTLYFYNDGINTAKISPTELSFVTVKDIHSINTSAPESTNWAANTPVTVGQYLNYGFNVYLVTGAGATGSSNNPPTHTSGAASNGTAQLTWDSLYVSAINFTRVSQVNVGSVSFPTKLVVNDEITLSNETVSTASKDLILLPFAGKKVTISANSSLVLPSGTTAQRGIPAQGSVRYSTSLSSFEGYNGTNWTSLGGVKDVDGNTYIIPETTPGANENILYFYNNGSNTLRLSTTELTFDTIDQIGSTSNNLDLQAQTVTFNSLSLTIDNSGSSTKFLSTKTNFDIALSVGLYTNPLIRLNTTGDIYVNKGFGTAVDSYIKVLDNELKLFELDDVKIESSEYILTKGTTNSNASVIYDPTLHSGAKVVIVANNITTDHREMYEMTVVSKGTDIFHTEYGNVTTGTDIITTLFDYDGSGRVRLTATLVAAITNGNVVNITVTSTVFKK
jgi:hypothetical protein